MVKKTRGMTFAPAPLPPFEFRRSTSRSCLVIAQRLVCVSVSFCVGWYDRFVKNRCDSRVAEFAVLGVISAVRLYPAPNCSVGWRMSTRRPA